jgi:hypothetical protein
MARDNWQQFQTQIKAVEVGSSGEPDHVLPIDTLEVKPTIYTPEGGTIRDLYDDRRVFDSPTFGFEITMEYAYDRADFRPQSFSTIDALLASYMAGAEYNVYVRYSEQNDAYITQKDGNAAYICYDMIPDITDSWGKVMFESQARQRPREIRLVSAKQNYTFPQIRWITE